MKKLLFIFVLACLMVSSFSVTTFATTLYVETMADGEWEYEDLDHDIDQTNDLSMTSLGMDFAINKFVYGFELILGTEDAGLSNGDNADFTSFNGKLGYRAVNNVNCNLDLIVKLDAKVYDDVINTTFNATLIGADLGFSLFENLYLQGSAFISIAGSVLTDDYYDYGYYYDGIDEDASCILLKARCTYFFTDSFGASLGYRHYSYKVKSSYNPQTTDSGLTAGLAFKF